MTSPVDTADPHRPDNVVPLRPDTGPTDPAAADDPSDTHYEITLDDEDPDPAGAAPVYVDLPPTKDGRRPIVPASLRRENLPDTVARAVGRWAHIACFHAARAPWYTLLAAFWSVAGVVRLTGRQLHWWWLAEQTGLRQEAATANDPAAWIRLHHEVKDTRRWRGLCLAAEVLALAVAVPVVCTVAPRPVALALAAVAVAWLAHVGRPDDRPIVSPAVVTGRFRKLTADVVLRAYYAAKLGDPDKPGQQVMFGSPMSRDGGGSRVLVDLPYGKGLGDALKAKAAIASGLDVSQSQVFLSRDPSSHRRHVLWVADRDPLAIPAGRTPLLRCKPTDIWTPAPFGLDERGNRVTVDLLWNSVEVGAQPRQGKTYSARALALFAALDPHVKLTVFDGKGSPDWRRFALVADRCGFGLALTRDGDPVDAFLAALREIKADVQDRYQRLSELPVDVCPDGKLTRAIARDPRYRMPVRVVVVDEFQEYFDLGEPSKEIAALLVYLVKVAPAAGICLIDATQRPSGVGTGQVAQQFISFRDNHQVRFALRTGSWQVSDLVLGAGAYAEGYDSSTLLPTYKGVGILRGASDHTATVRTYLADAADAEKILRAARALREHAGTLTGHAAGQAMAREVRDVLADVRTVFDGETFAAWQALAARLADRIPEHYAEVTADAISAQLRALGVPSVNGKRDGVVLKGAKADAVAAAIARRQATG
jgi:S-DNA-T family DNA segregation ATPase FtsK/SpoIIIE